MNLESMYKKIANAETSGDGIYLLDGAYRIRVELVKFFETRKHKTMFLVEMTILQSTNEARPAGMEVSWMCNLTDHDAAFGNVKQFLGACFGVDPNDKEALDAQITPTVISQSTAVSNPLGGTILPVECETRNNKTNEGKHTRHRWSIAQGRDPNWVPKSNQGATPTPPPVQRPTAPSIPGAPPIGIPGVPNVPGAPAIPPPPPALFPPPGWTPHPQAPGYYYQGQQVLSEAQLRAM